MANPTEWVGVETSPNTHISFTFPATKYLPNGTYYWWAWTWSTFPVVTNFSEIRKLVVSGAVYPWKIGGVEIAPARDGVKEEIEIVGCGRVEKRTYQITFAPMEEAKRNLLKAVFDLNTWIWLTDNENIQRLVYWGDCDRNISGSAFPPMNRQFGITQTNHISGALRWSGTANFTEV